MDAIEILPLISRWLHILASLILVGGTFFLRFILLPIADPEGPEQERRELIRKRWSKTVALSVLFLLISGLYNSAVKSIGYQLDGVYLTLLTVKILLALAIFFLVSVLAGRSNLAARFRANERQWYNLTLTAMVVLICMAGYMKMSPQELKPDSPEDPIAKVQQF